MSANAQLAGPIVPSSPFIYYIEPTSGMAGTKVTIIGFGFSASNTVHFGEQTIADVPIAWSAGITCIQGDSRCHPGINQALLISIPPAATAGQYDLSVESANGVSNAVPFTVGAP